MIDIPLGVKAQCNGSKVGKITHVIIDPLTYQVTHLVVEEKKTPHTKRLIPMKLVRETADDHILLHLTKAELPKQENFMGSYLKLVEFPNYYREPMSVLWPWFKDYTERIKADFERIPSGERAVRFDAKVKATDGLVGHVDGFLTAPSNFKIIRLILRVGHLWGTKQISIPVSEIRFFTERTIYLKLCKAEIDSLPEYISLSDK